MSGWLWGSMGVEVNAVVETKTVWLSAETVPQEAHRALQQGVNDLKKNKKYLGDYCTNWEETSVNTHDKEYRLYRISLEK